MKATMSLYHRHRCVGVMRNIGKWQFERGVIGSQETVAR
ncbi:hypothetical protein LMG28140_04192 [Paraburkholderia metrosideri]|jgi:hypothetical protein|uniref:Transposase n=1 Tax=Paraburkholderia metrosideri TaxID=580937 RepID=A0ABM8NVP7_9BURK|nr:hypothetical protein LMG28140_04192 [Paraburkholderia metrosideri]